MSKNFLTEAYQKLRQRLQPDGLYEGGTGIAKAIGCTECTSVPVTGGQLCCTELQIALWGKRSDAQDIACRVTKVGHPLARMPHN